MASRRNRIIYASQSVHAEGRVLYRVQTLGSSTTFNTTDIFELGQLNLTDVVDDNPEVAVTLDTNDYGSIYTMATLAKVPTQNLNHNIRQSDGITFAGTVSGSIPVGTGDLDLIAGLPAASGTGKSNLVIKTAPGGTALAYVHGVSLPDFGRDCGISKGVDLYSPIQTECALGTANNEIEFTKLLRDVFINRMELNYQSSDISTENYGGETEQKQWFLNAARFLSWEEWRVGSLTSQIAAATLAAKSSLVLSLPASATVATLEDKSIGFLKRDLAGRPAVLFQFVNGGGLTVGESKSVAVFDKGQCTPTSVLEYFLYDSATNELEYFSNGLADTLDAVLPAARSAFQAGDRIFVFYAADQYAVEVGGPGRPGGADSSYVSAKYFAPISSEDTEDIGAVRQGQVEAYLVDPDLILTSLLTGATISATQIQFNNTVSNQIDLSRFLGLKIRIKEGPGKNGPARAIIAAVNNISGNFNNGTLTLGGAAWSSIRLYESTSQASTVSGVYVSDLCGIDNAYAGSDITVLVGGNPTTTTVSGVDSLNNLITFNPVISGAPDNGTEVLVSVEPTTASEVIIGDYELALRLQNVTITADMTREQLKEIGRLNPYARTLNIPINFTVTIESTASDLETFAKFAGKGNKFAAGTLTDLDIVDLLAKDNITVAVMVYQQTDQEAGGTGLDRKVLSPDMFNDEYFVNGIRNTYAKTDGSAREYPLKTVIAQNLRITDEGTNTPIQGNATQSFGFRGTNEVTQVRGYLDVDLVAKTIESQGD
jgi:hypothetical protein